MALVAAVVTPAALAQFAPVTPESSNAEGIRRSYLFVTIFTFAIFVLVEGLLIPFVFRYRRSKRARFEDGAQVHGATKLELAWTAFPVVVLFLIGTFVFIELPGIKNIPEATAGEEQLEIKVTGRQFYWQYEYPDGVIAIDHMRAPAGVPVRLVVTAPVHGRHPLLVDPRPRREDRRDPGQDERHVVRGGRRRHLLGTVRRALRPRARADARLGRGHVE